MPPCIHFAGRIHPHHREVITGWAWSWRGAFQRLADHSKQHTGKGASGIFYISSHLPVAFIERALCSWYFVFLVKEEGKQEKGQMVHGGGAGGDWHWKIWKRPVPMKAFGSVLPSQVKGNAHPVSVQARAGLGLPHRHLSLPLEFRC